MPYALDSVHPTGLRVPDTAHTPFFPGSKEEGWWVFLADVSSNALLAVQKVRHSLPY
jgi:hypothetical protein